jgi:hypothetical protein
VAAAGAAAAPPVEDEVDAEVEVEDISDILPDGMVAVDAPVIDMLPVSVAIVQPDDNAVEGAKFWDR